MSESTKARLWALALSLALMAAALLIVRINTLEISLAYLALLAGVVLLGLVSNLWGGLAASAVAVFAVVLVNQYAGIYPRENRILNIASELIAFLLAGPLAGMLSGAVEAVQRQADHWMAQAEDQTVLDPTFDTLKPEWAKLRLEEEVLRAVRFGRPLSVVVIELKPGAERAASNPTALRAERIGALQALIRTARSAALPPAVVAYLGSDRVLVILPEQTPEQAGQFAADLRSRAGAVVYSPLERGAQPLSNKSLGKPLREWGVFSAGIAGLEGLTEARMLLERAEANLQSGEVNGV